MFCACEMRPRVMLTRCTKLTQLEATWDLCRAQGTQGLGFVCEFVGNMADDPMTKNMQNSTGCYDTIIRESLSVPSLSVISNVHNIRRQGEEVVADDAKKGSIPLRLVNQAKIEEQKYIEKLYSRWPIEQRQVEENMISTRWVITNKGTPEKPNVRTRWFAQEFNGWTAQSASKTLQILD